MKIGYIALVVAFILSLMCLPACGFYVGVDWNGQTAKDFKTYTEKVKK